MGRNFTGWQNHKIELLSYDYVVRDTFYIIYYNLTDLQNALSLKLLIYEYSK